MRKARTKDDEVQNEALLPNTSLKEGKGSGVTRRRKQRQELKQGKELRRRGEPGGENRTLRPWRKMKRKKLTEVRG